MQKKLYKKTSNKMISGVCAGLADYLNIDATLVRVLYAVLSLFTTGFPGLILYIILALVMPTEEEVMQQHYQQPPYQQPPYQQPPYQQPPYQQPHYQQPPYQQPAQPQEPQEYTDTEE